jgi:hypothetical protein
MKSSNIYIAYLDFINESNNPKENFEEFCKNRLAGATKITEMAQKKGGDALLTFHHFEVKLPIYSKAAAGKFKLSEATTKLDGLVSKLNQSFSSTEGVKMSQTQFQKLVGLIEVWGELIIRFKQK